MPNEGFATFGSIRFAAAPGGWRPPRCVSVAVVAEEVTAEAKEADALAATDTLPPNPSMQGQRCSLEEGEGTPLTHTGSAA